MPRLSSLIIYDDGMYSKEEAAPLDLNAALFARLPMLDPRDLVEWHRQSNSRPNEPTVLLNGLRLVPSGRRRK